VAANDARKKQQEKLKQIALINQNFFLCYDPYLTPEIVQINLLLVYHTDFEMQ